MFDDKRDASAEDLRLVAEGLAVRRGYRTLFLDLSLSLGSGSIIQLFGPNGSGKSTLLRTLAGFNPPDAGKIRWEGAGEEIDTATLFHYSGHREGLSTALTPRENLAFACGVLSGDTSRIEPALRTVGALRLGDLPVRVLSAGQKRRVALARLLVAPRPFWLLDEPLAALDSEGQLLVAQLLAAHAHAGGAALVATHHALDLPSTRLTLGDLSREAA